MSCCTAGKIVVVHKRWARYLAGDPALTPLMAWDWRQPAWEQVLQVRATFPLDRATLVDALVRQNAPFVAQDPALRTNIEALRLPTTFTITTGQQPGWLTGPLYTLIKAIHTVQLAEALNQTFAGRYRVVPVFWIASEDHDAEEVRNVALSWTRTLRYGGDFAGAVGRHGIQDAFPPEAQKLALQAYWQPGVRWEVAFRHTMQALFQGTGLIWLSPDDPALKALAAPLWIREVEEHLTAHAHTLASQYLASIGEKPLLHARTINLFWLSDTERRYPSMDEREELRRAARIAPESLSPNVLLRPLMQAYILPDLAYVAGPGEVAYWLELLPVFTAFGVPMPVVYPRGHLRVLPPTEPPLPPGLSINQIWGLSQARLRMLLAELWGSATLQEAMNWWQTHRPPVEELIGRPGWSSAARTLQHLWQQWGQTLRRSILRHNLHQYRKQIAALMHFRQMVEPEGRLQERTLNIHAFAPAHPVPWLRRLMGEVYFSPGEFSLYRAEGTFFVSTEAG